MSRLAQPLVVCVDPPHRVARTYRAPTGRRRPAATARRAGDHCRWGSTRSGAGCRTDWRSRRRARPPGSSRRCSDRPASLASLAGGEGLASVNRVDGGRRSRGGGGPGRAGEVDRRRAARKRPDGRDAADQPSPPDSPREMLKRRVSGACRARQGVAGRFDRGHRSTRLIQGDIDAAAKVSTNPEHPTGPTSTSRRSRALEASENPKLKDAPIVVDHLSRGRSPASCARTR